MCCAFVLKIFIYYIDKQHSELFLWVLYLSFSLFLAGNPAYNLCTQNNTFLHPKQYVVLGCFPIFIGFIFDCMHFIFCNLVKCFLQNTLCFYWVISLANSSFSFFISFSSSFIFVFDSSNVFKLTNKCLYSTGFIVCIIAFFTRINCNKYTTKFFC